MSDLRNLQLALLQVLHTFVDICEKNDLHYYAMDGTLLGMIRHQGFIPWDDDVDISMPREDYERLPEILDKNMLPGMHYKYFKNMDQDAKDIQGGIRIYSDIAQAKTNFYGEEIIEDVNIDIFPLDGMPENRITNIIQQFRLLSIKAITKLSQVDQIRTFVTRSKIDNMIIKVGKKIRLDKHLNTKNWYMRLDNALKRFSYKNASTVCVFWSDYRFHEMVPKSWYEPAEKKRFEDIDIPSPARPVEILERLYGDWQSPPLEGQKQKHPIELLESGGGGNTSF